MYWADEKLTNFWLMFQKAGSKGCFRLLFCKASPEKLPDLVLHAKRSFSGRKYTDEYTVNSFQYFAWTFLNFDMSYKWHKKINNNTNIHLDLRQIGCHCIRPTASYNNSQYCANIIYKTILHVIYETRVPLFYHGMKTWEGHARWGEAGTFTSFNCFWTMMKQVEWVFHMTSQTPGQTGE